MGNYYDEKSSEFYNRTIKDDLTALYDKFLPYLPKGGKILDAGCGVGRDSKEFFDRGFHVSAFDASAEMVRLARATSGLPVKQKTFDEIEYGEEFDGVWACATLLHIPEKKLAPTVQKLLNALKVDGVLFVSFKYGEGEHIRDERFFNDQNETSLGKLVKRLHGAHLLEMWRSVGRRPGDTQVWLNAIIRRASI